MKEAEETLAVPLYNDLLSKYGIQYHALNPDTVNLDEAYLKWVRMCTIKRLFSEISDPNSKLRTCGTIKQSIGGEEY